LKKSREINLHKIYFWSEFLKFEYLIPIIPKLGSYEVGLNLAITPKKLSRVSNVVKECERNGVELSFWPLLSRKQGYWVNAWNIDIHIKWIDYLLKDYPTVSAYLLDLEDPIEWIYTLKGNVKIKKLNKLIPEDRVMEKMNSIVDNIHDYNKLAVSTSYGIFSFGAQARPSNADIYSYMVYTSLLNLISNKDTRLNIIYYASNKIKKEHGQQKGAIDLGITYAGAVKIKLVEKYFTLAVDELIQQIEICLFSKIRRIHLFAIDNITKNIDNTLERISNLKPKKPPLYMNGKKGFTYRIYKKKTYKRNLSQFK